MIVADASWVIALRDPEDEHHEKAKEIRAAAGSQIPLLNVVTVAECLVGAAKQGKEKKAEADIKRVFEMVPVDDGAPLRWARLRHETDLLLPDVVVLDTALHQQASTIATFDQELAERSAEKGLEVIGTRVQAA